MLWILKPQIIGTTKLHRLKENIGGASVTLTSADLSKIKDSLGQIEIIGERYPQHLQARVGK